MDRPNLYQIPRRAFSFFLVNYIIRKLPFFEKKNMNKVKKIIDNCHLYYKHILNNIVALYILCLNTYLIY